MTHSSTGVRYRIVYFSPDPFLADWHIPFGAVFEQAGGWVAVEASVMPQFRPEDKKLEACFKMSLERLRRDTHDVWREGPLIHMGTELRLPPGVANPSQFLRDHVLPGRKERNAPDGR